MRGADRAAPGAVDDRDSIEDLEAVRKLVGAERISLYGVSYGTKLAVAYADRYPDRVERAVADSLVLPEGIDLFARATFTAVPGALADLCADGRCRGITADPAADLTRLADRLRRGPCAARWCGPTAACGATACARPTWSGSW